MFNPGFCTTLWWIPFVFPLNIFILGIVICWRHASGINLECKSWLHHLLCDYGQIILSYLSFSFLICKIRLRYFFCNPLQCSCLENPRAGGAWWAAVCGVAQRWTWLKRFSIAYFFCKIVCSLSETLCGKRLKQCLAVIRYC